MKNSRCVLRNLAVLAGMDCAATLGGKLFAALGVPETNIVVLYLFAVLLVARLTQGYQYGILASVTSLLTSAMTTKEKILTRQANERGGGKPDSLYALQPPVRRRRHGTGPWRGAGQREQAAAGGCGLCLSWRPGAADRAAAGWGQIIHRRVEDAGELRARFTDLRTEYLAGEEGFCVWVPV